MTIKTWQDKYSGEIENEIVDRYTQLRWVQQEIDELRAENEALKDLRIVASELTEWHDCALEELNQLRVKLAAIEAQEPLGTLAFYRHLPPQFYRHPESPYLDNALDCKTVYLAAGAKLVSQIQEQALQALSDNTQFVELMAERNALQARLDALEAELLALREQEPRIILTIEQLQLKAALKLGTEHDRIAELEAELRALKTQEPIGYVSENDWSCAYLHHDNTPGNPVYAAAGAKGKEA